MQNVSFHSIGITKRLAIIPTSQADCEYWRQYKFNEYMVSNAETHQKNLFIQKDAILSELLTPNCFDTLT